MVARERGRKSEWMTLGDGVRLSISVTNQDVDDVFDWLGITEREDRNFPHYNHLLAQERKRIFDRATY